MTTVNILKDGRYPVSIYIPTIDSWATIKGACVDIVDGKSYLRLQCEDEQGKIHLLNLDTVQSLFNAYPVPF